MLPLTRAELLGLFAGGPHQFKMGLRRSDAVPWLDPVPADPATAAVLMERIHWLKENPQRHAVSSPSAEPLLAATIAWRQNLGGRPIEASLPLLGSIWTPDFLLLRRNDEGEFCFVGGCVCFPSSWAPEEKIGLPLTAIHAAVPGLNPQIGARIRTFFDRLPPEGVFERSNWSLAATPELNLHPALNRPRLGPTARLAQTYLRVERQAFIRLPEHEGLLFLIRLELHPLAEVVQDAEIRDAFVAHFSSLPNPLASYKGLATARPTLLQQLSNLQGHPI